MEIIDENELEEKIKLEKGYNVIKDDINDKTRGKFLSYYNYLTCNIIKLVSNEDKKKVMYSRYYWYTKYKKRYFEINGYDAGMEQESFKLLEEIGNELEEGADWSIIKEIDESIK